MCASQPAAAVDDIQRVLLQVLAPVHALARFIASTPQDCADVDLVARLMARELAASSAGESSSRA